MGFNAKCTFCFCKWIYQGALNQVGTNNDLMTALAEQGPVSVAVDINNAAGTVGNWYYYGTGTFASADCGTSINHAVNVIGYGEDSNGKYWLIRNSWSDTWGESGYMKLERSSGNTAGIGPCALLMLPAYPLV